LGRQHHEEDCLNIHLRSNNIVKTKNLSVKKGEKVGIDNFPSFHKSGSIHGMKKKYYGKDALLVRCGNYIYNVTTHPEIYRMAK